MAPPAGQVALTFDDLPALTFSTDTGDVERFIGRLRKGLVRHRLPATGFVVEGKLDDDGLKAGDKARLTRILAQWLDAGFDLGNHSYSHGSPNALGADAYTQDIARGEVVTRGLLAARGGQLRWYRHPYLETGATAATRDAIDGWLAAHGYGVAPVTMNANDWEFAEPYDDAVLHGNKARARQIRRAYLAYTARMIDWYREAAHAVVGRDIAYVMLLHGARLNADCVDDLARMLKRANLKAVPLDQAMRDPAYQAADTYAGADGIDWLERWSLALNKPMPWEDFREVPEDIVADYRRIDPDQGGTTPASGGQ
ncbi:MAG TPA: polysaccharide deacetylase family protein, partial [Novosphingobium sp.]|nr:polysaccharide deacetylase family protein [Novosphingobium sp.]